MSEQKVFFEEAYDVLGYSTLFGKLKEEHLKNMILQCQEITWCKSDTIDYQLGEKYLFIIITGRLKVTHIDPESGRSLALDHIHFSNQKGMHFVHLINDLSNESLAEMIGSVRSVVSTQMKKLKEEGIIFIENRRNI